MEKNNDFSFGELEVIFNDELRIYLSLEKSIYEFMDSYEKERSEILKDIILKVISNAKEQIITLLGMISNYYIGELKVKYSNTLGMRLNNLQTLEEKLRGKIK